MLNLKVIKMCNLSPFHIGMGRDYYDSSAMELHSDTISAALASVGVTTGLCKDVRQFLSSFVISSAFPYWKDIYFLPKPQGRLNVSVGNLQEYEYRKQLKAVRYIESSLWKELVLGKDLSIETSQLKGNFIVPKGIEIGDICKKQVTQRVNVSRDGSKDAEPFFFEWNYYDKEAGLYCLLDAEKGLTDEIVKLFSILGDIGIGTDKSVGGGKFEVEVGSMDISEPIDADSTMLLSLYIPTREEYDELLNGEPLYSFLQRGGYMAGSDNLKFRHLRKKSIYMFNVGSVFRTTNVLRGKVVDVRPDWNDAAMHPVYRSGRVLTIRIKTKAL